MKNGYMRFGGRHGENQGREAELKEQEKKKDFLFYF